MASASAYGVPAAKSSGASVRRTLAAPGGGGGGRSFEEEEKAASASGAPLCGLMTLSWPLLREMDAGPFDLLGLFQGVGLAQDGATPETGRLPNMVFLYRRAILDYWAEHEDSLGAVVTHVLVHEIGHHFGLSDDDMYGIEDRAG